MTQSLGTSGHRDRPEGVQEFVARHLVSAIISGELAPGHRLSPSRLASEFKVSHIPVREALAALEASGHVKRVPRVGFFVADLSFEEFEDMYHWRQVLEDEANRIAVTKLTAEDFARMRELLGKMSSKEPGSGHLKYAREFHFVAFEAAGSASLLRFLNHLWDASQRYQNTRWFVKFPYDIAAVHHEALVEAYEAKDADRVNAIMVEHRGVTLDAIGKLQVEPKEQSGTA